MLARGHNGNSTSLLDSMVWSGNETFRPRTSALCMLPAFFPAVRLSRICVFRSRLLPAKLFSYRQDAISNHPRPANEASPVLAAVPQSSQETIAHFQE